ncbi:hypothetical protein GCM10010168_61980 [Actinoplanes ianthinogenes]|uniref:Integral membrane protein n=1 Tax=Actinoplanes ianthinogenes TaxID=122358 RepID=A0ABN6CPQ3_9ACTN|nr:hypothetical protein [Actinoplanes ianthinogenes]BCJ46559.1 hypothetical protein Aiant_72160 [Actinoplanes ianthinogenes]GGR35097.1 hypothetical protein GCM10010168_61980 [Actinoplanes ianthinogenes]
MTTAPLAHADTLVLDYLAALWAASDDLPPTRRDELMKTVTDYLAMRHEPGTDPTPVLTRLGPPDELAEVTRRGYLPLHLRLPTPISAPPAVAPVPARVPVVGGPESTVIALLIGGTFLMPGLAPGAGLLIATGSPRWSVGQKAAGWVLAAGSCGVAMLVVLVLAGWGAGAGVALLLGYLAACAGSVAAGLTLLTGMRRD